jgi:hypothetical protein
MATKTSTLYGLLAEFDREDQVVDATRRIYEAGYRRIDAYAPFPVHGLAEAMGRKRTWVPTVVLAGGVMGGLGGFFMQWYSAVVDYPLNVGGRPMNSWPAFIPIVFELTVLGAALAAVFGMLAMNGLPQPYHPVFHVRNFELASRSRFFLLVTSRDAKFDLERTRRDLESLSPRAIHEVPH